jgi:DNA-directed RNA polymerase subunit RPC12/RpoP
MLEKEYGIKRKESEKAKNIYTKWILLEHSDVPVPSNAQSLNLAVAKGDLVIHSEKLRNDFEIDVEMDTERPELEIYIETERDPVVNMLPAFPHKSDGSKLNEEELDRLIEIVKEEAVKEPDAVIDEHKDIAPPDEKQDDEDDEEDDDSDEGEKFNCECIECGHKLTSETHCNELECPKCGCHHFETYKTIQGQSAKFRYKACRHCGHKVLTSTHSSERIVRDISPPETDADEDLPPLMMFAG